MAHPEFEEASASPQRIRQEAGGELGPLPEPHVRALIAAGLLSERDEVEQDGGWRALREVPVYAGALRRRACHRAVVEALFDPVAAEAAGLGDLLEALWAGAGIEALATEEEVAFGAAEIDEARPAAVIPILSATGSLEAREAPNPAAPPAPDPVALSDDLAVEPAAPGGAPEEGDGSANWLDAVDDELDALLAATNEAAPFVPDPEAPLRIGSLTLGRSAENTAAVATDGDRAMTNAAAPSVLAARREQAARRPEGERRSYEAEWVDLDAIGTCDVDTADAPTLVRSGLRQLAASAFAEAQVTFSLIPEHEDDGVAAGGLAYARFMRASTPEDQLECLREVESCVEAAPDAPVLRLFAARMAHLFDDDATARVHLSALGAADLPVPELIRLRDDTLEKVKSRGPSKRPEAPASSVAAPAPRPSWAARPAIGLGLVFVLLAGLGALGLGTDLGLEELTYRLDNAVFWARRLAVGGLGALLAYFAFTRGAAPREHVPTRPAALAAAVAVGLPLGVMTPAPTFGGSVGVAAVMGLAHVVAEEILFRGYVDRLLSRHLKGWVAPALVSGQIYGAYHLGYGGLLESGTLVETVVVAAIGGTAYAVLYQRTKSVIAPFVCHAVAQLTLIGLAA